MSTAYVICESSSVFILRNDLPLN